MHARTHARTHMHAQTHARTRAHMHARTRMRQRTHARELTCTHAHARAYARARIHAHTHLRQPVVLAGPRLVDLLRIVDDLIPRTYSYSTAGWLGVAHEPAGHPESMCSTRVDEVAQETTQGDGVLAVFSEYRYTLGVLFTACSGGTYLIHLSGGEVVVLEQLIVEDRVVQIPAASTCVVSQLHVVLRCAGCKVVLFPATVRGCESKPRASTHAHPHAHAPTHARSHTHARTRARTRTHFGVRDCAAEVSGPQPNESWTTLECKRPRWD
jgi:hypothetical protein